ncbi:AraC family transcriptional regulator [Aureimonas pseudogalii]|uniref:AraC-like DNA-binding protein n=1 Tax=Aureimonas pseudogalii TaxID=1744844 RepID=A0A7W6MMI4_9HYPH|nr:AraC family transcriptional regulator [Aureimonas pseudogalii]MBB4000872.1 AraC-like DNA-binding protein [Aureimonas pseudogalii]
MAAYAKRGIDPSQALAKAGLPSVGERPPGGRVTAEQFEALSGHAMRELDDEALGWFSRRLPWGSYGMLCRASLSAPNLGLAASRWCRHHALLADDVTLHLEVGPIAATLRIEERRDLGPFREFCTVSLLRNFHGIASWLVDSRIQMSAASFPFPAPAHAGSYGHLFPGVSPSFGAESARIEFDPAYLDLRLLRSEDDATAMLKRPLVLMVRQYQRDRLLSKQVRAVLERSSSVGVDDVATELRMSIRSLHRRLQQESTSVQALKDDIRRRRAESLLATTRWPLKRIGQEIGFEAESSFVRAFKTWTGTTPAAFRNLSRSR